MMAPTLGGARGLSPAGLQVQSPLRPPMQTAISKTLRIRRTRRSSRVAASPGLRRRGCAAYANKVAPEARTKFVRRACLAHSVCAVWSVYSRVSTPRRRAAKYAAAHVWGPAYIARKIRRHAASTHAHLLAILARYTESTGALSPAVILLLKELGKAAQGTDGADSTVYGLGRASPQSCFPHHLARRYYAAISSSIVRADALSLSTTTRRHWHSSSLPRHHLSTLCPTGHSS
jgi:hypothetical protein